MSFFVSSAYAAAANPQQSENLLQMPLLIIAIFAAFYFMLIRPQNKRAKEQQQLLASLKKGDEVLTVGGIVAKITNLDEQYIKVSPSEGLELIIQRNAVSSILPKGTIKSL